MVEKQAIASPAPMVMESAVAVRQVTVSLVLVENLLLVVGRLLIANPVQMVITSRVEVSLQIAN